MKSTDEAPSAPVQLELFPQEQCKLVIAGSRTLLPSMADIDDALAASGLKPTEIVSGRARGADTQGERWAAKEGVVIAYYPADWSTFGRKAGMIRNEEMAGYADAALIFWDGESRGTGHMIDYMRSLGKPVHVVRKEAL